MGILFGFVRLRFVLQVNMAWAGKMERFFARFKKTDARARTRILLSPPPISGMAARWADKTRQTRLSGWHFWISLVSL